MKAIVVFDSAHGNTEKIARAVAGALTGPMQVTVLRAAQTKLQDLAGADLVAVGGPTVGGRATPAMQAFLDRLLPGSLAGVRAITFDTRMEIFVARLFGYAAIRIRDALESKGARILVDPEGFVVNGREGPLKSGEQERAAEWARTIPARMERPT